MTSLKSKCENILTHEIRDIIRYNYNAALEEAYDEIRETIINDEFLNFRGEDITIDIVEDGIYINGSYDYYYTDQFIRIITSKLKDEWR